MDTERVVSAMGVVLLLAGSLPAIAQDYYPPDRRGYEAGRDDRGPPDDRPHPDDRQYRGRDDRGGPPRQWRQGDRFDGPRYVVDDYRRYDLPPPPDDRHRWVRDPDGNFLLVAIASGVITNLLLNAGHHGR